MPSPMPYEFRYCLVALARGISQRGPIRFNGADWTNCRCAVLDCLDQRILPCNNVIRAYLVLSALYGRATNSRNFSITEVRDRFVNSLGELTPRALENTLGWVTVNSCPYDCIDFLRPDNRYRLSLLKATAMLPTRVLIIDRATGLAHRFRTEEADAPTVRSILSAFYNGSRFTYETDSDGVPHSRAENTINIRLVSEDRFVRSDEPEQITAAFLPQGQLRNPLFWLTSAALLNQLYNSYPENADRPSEQSRVFDQTNPPNSCIFHIRRSAASSNSSESIANQRTHPLSVSPATSTATVTITTTPYGDSTARNPLKPDLFD